VRPGIVADPGAAVHGFGTDCLAVPAGTPFTLTFENRDPGVPHNVEIFRTSAAAQRLGGAKGPGDAVTGPGRAVYRVSALPPGTYYFQCDIHPTTMQGTLVVTGSSTAPGSP
jgi:plastocyanin